MPLGRASRWQTPGTCFLPLLLTVPWLASLSSLPSRAWCFQVANTRFDAASIKMVAAAHPKECCGLCRDVEFCTSFTWAPQVCISHLLPPSPTFSHLLPPSPTSPHLPPPSPTFSHLPSHASPTFSHLPSHASTWAPQEGGTCWLKQWAGTAVHREGFVSGHFSRRASCACRVRQATALHFPDGNASFIAHVQRPASGGCCAACMDYDGCGAWTWAPTIRAGCTLYRSYLPWWMPSPAHRPWCHVAGAPSTAPHPRRSYIRTRSTCPPPTTSLV